MEQLQNFSLDFLSRSLANTLDAEQYYNDVFANLQEEFMRAQPATDTVQKTKKPKQAIEPTIGARKATAAAGDPDGGSNSSNKENVDRSNAIDSEESSILDSTNNQRPVRARRTKLQNLRESLISGEKKIRIKKEPVDKPPTKPKSPPAVLEPPVIIPETPVAPEKRKSSQDEGDAAANLSTESNKKVKLDDSVELIAKKPDLIELSDDEAEMMPPPALPAAKTRKPRTKKQSTAPPNVSASVQVKQEPVEEVIGKRSTRSKVAKATTTTTTTTKAQQKKAAAEEASEELFENIIPKVRNSSLANASTLSTETSVTTAQAQKPTSASQPVTEPEKTRSKARTKSKKPVIDKVTKLVIPEPVTVPVVQPEEEAAVEETRKSSSSVDKEKEEEEEEREVPATKGKKTSKKSNHTSKKQQSTESVYEDAKSDSKLYSSKVSLENIQKPSQDDKDDDIVPPSVQSPPFEPAPVQMEVEMELPNVNNETFVSTNNCETVEPVVNPVTAAIKAAAAAVAVCPSPQLDSTFNVAPPPPAPATKGKKSSAPHPDASIMTEDLSMVVKQEPIDSPPRKAPTVAKTAPPKGASAKKAHEIFNPFVQSPVKAKVDAYERHAKESKIPVTPKYNHVPRLPAPVGMVASSQPLPMRVQRDNDTTPLKSGGHLLGSTTSDTTGNKLAHMKKVLGKGAALSSDSARGSSSTISSSTTSSLSAKPLQRTASATDVDAKRIANTLHLAAEEKKRKREEKQRLAQQNREKMEREKKEQLDKLAKEREEKAKKFLLEKAEQAKQEKKKQAMARLAMENSQQMKIKELQMKQKAAHPDPNGYGWDLLRSEESTDDEEKATNKLPPPPSWSRDPFRTRLANQQTAIPSNMIDTLFGLKPMSPDLREIFPDIDPKLLKRNSSMIWKTPPRFSRIERP